MIDTSGLRFPKPTRPPKEPKPLKPCKVAIESNPLEETEQMTVVDWLKWHGVLFSASANGIYTHPASMSRMKRLGVAVGLPDILIFTPPPAYKGIVGVSIEMKRRKGGIVSQEQLEWKEKLQKVGWLTYIALGADQAIGILEACGYGSKKPKT